MRYIVIHGHFYQPPRENPWTERVGREVSAHPFHNWNARIQRECYAPNRAARILNDDKRIGSIVNNYERISFNFGPTLLDWMVRRDPVTLEALVEADRLSRARLGHGNALAQAYNHSILPLLDRRDKVTQVRWGKTHFRRLFGREPEGMWLPETAADLETLDVLAEESIRFTVLAPWQLTGVRAAGDGAWRGEIRAEDLGRAYRCATGAGREMALFFYDGGIAQQVAFGDLLKSGDAFSARVETAALERSDQAPLVNLATDGETYGHHHRFGEMALAYMLQRVGRRENTEVTNYAAFLDRFPPTLEARILERGSWSCVHGVERWRADCGCRTGGEPGWNQAWRAPLFEAMRLLRGELAGVFEREGSRHLRDPWAARDGYIDVLFDPGADSKSAFLDRHGRPGADAAVVWRLLEMERHALLMFTSCGWFFNDLAGIETLQVLRYAGRALELCGTFGTGMEDRFLAVLAGAVTNRLPRQTGDQLFREVMHASRVDPARVAAEHILAKRLGLGDDESSDVKAFAVDLVPAGDDGQGRVEVIHRRTGELSSFDYRVEMDATPHLGVILDRTSDVPAWRVPAVEDPAGALRSREIGPEELDPEAAERLSHRFLKRLETETVRQLKSLLKSREPVVRFLEAKKIRPPRALGRLLEAVWLEELLEEFAAPPGLGDGTVASWAGRLERFRTLQLTRDDHKLSLALTRRLQRETEYLCLEHSEGSAEILLELLRVAETLDPRPDLWEAQNFFYRCAVGEGPVGTEGHAGVPEALRREVASRLGFTPELVDQRD